ncbi:MAG: hypothetical protein ABI580_06095 [Burkholderiaceae bacterium]
MVFLARLKRSVAGLLPSLAAPAATTLDIALQLELSREFDRLQAELRMSTPENPASRGFKVYSQADEDGILEDICLRMGLEGGVFAEIGCGDGRENNTHYLLLKGWRGVWIDGDPTNISAIRTALPTNNRLRLIEALVTRENIVDLLRPALEPLGPCLDVLSIDIDGNDLTIARAAIAALNPKIVIGEYNAKFPYPMVAEITYVPQHKWHGDDYHGASLAAWVQQLAPDYQLVSCNLAGTNAFFVHKQFMDRFGGYPPEMLYQRARFHLTALRAGHAPSLSHLKQMLTDAAKARDGVNG